MLSSGSSTQVRESNSGNSFETFVDEELDEDSQVKTALVMSAISIALWVIAILGFVVKFAGGESGPNAAASAVPQDRMEAGMN